LQEQEPYFQETPQLLERLLQNNFRKKIAHAQKQGLVSVTKQPPVKKVIIPKEISEVKPVEVVIGRTVTIYNQTPALLRYALNDEVYELEAGNGFKHSTESGEFFLQYDDNLDNTFNVARYYLSGQEYGLLVEQEPKVISIRKYK
jgi:hypothetical protein